MKEKWDKWRERNRNRVAPATLTAERLSVELLVNQRRQERGLKPWDFEAERGMQAAAPSESQNALWDRVEALHRSGGSQTPSLPAVHVPEGFLEAARAAGSLDGIAGGAYAASGSSPGAADGAQMAKIGGVALAAGDCECPSTVPSSSSSTPSNPAREMR